MFSMDLVRDEDVWKHVYFHGRVGVFNLIFGPWLVGFAARQGVPRRALGDREV